MTDKKSIWVCYFYWLIGGWCGLHQIYLRRDRHAFLIWSSAAGYLGCGLLRDLWRIPEYVRDANEDPGYMEKLITSMRERENVCKFFCDILSLLTKRDSNIM